MGNELSEDLLLIDIVFLSSAAKLLTSSRNPSKSDFGTVTIALLVHVACPDLG